MSRATLRASLVLGLASLLGGCSEDPDGGGGPGGAGGGGNVPSGIPDPCTLVSMAELEAIVDKDLVKTIGEIEFGDPRCDWFEQEFNFGVFALVLFATSERYDFVKDLASAKSLSGVGDEARVANLSSVYVKAPGRAFFSQSMYPVKDGQVSPEVQTAQAGATAAVLATTEASFRFAKLVVSKL